MPFKFDQAGNIVTQEINGAKLPVFIHADSKEAPFDADSTLGTISRLNAEAKGHRERAEVAEGKLKGFDGITDPVAALKALQTVKNLDDKKLVDAGEVEKVKAEAMKSLRAEFEPALKERDALREQLYAEKIGGSFARSKYISEKVAIPADMVQAAFGRHFTIEAGKMIAKDPSGNQVYSRTRHGEPADFEEALEILIDGYPHKASILKGSGASGGGAGSAGSNGGQGGGGKRVLTREQFTKLSPAEQMAHSKSIREGKAELID